MCESCFSLSLSDIVYVFRQEFSVIAAQFVILADAAIARLLHNTHSIA